MRSVTLYKLDVVLSACKMAGGYVTIRAVAAREAGSNVMAAPLMKVMCHDAALQPITTHLALSQACPGHHSQSVSRRFTLQRHVNTGPTLALPKSTLRRRDRPSRACAQSHAL